MFQIAPVKTDIVIDFSEDTQNSGELKLDAAKGQFVGIVQPSAIDGTVLTLQASWDGGSTWVSVEIITFAASFYVALDPGTYRGVYHIRLRSTTEQTADRTFGIVQSII